MLQYHVASAKLTYNYSRKYSTVTLTGIKLYETGELWNSI
jgi:hypothetical protein